MAEWLVACANSSLVEPIISACAPLMWPPLWNYLQSLLGINQEQGRIFLPRNQLQLESPINGVEAWRDINVGGNDSRFRVVAELLAVPYTLIEVTEHLDSFSAGTNYIAHLIFKKGMEYRGLDTFFMASVTLEKRPGNKNYDLMCQKLVCIDPTSDMKKRNKCIFYPVKLGHDNWEKLELGRFHNNDDRYGNVVVRLQLANNNCQMKGLLVAGIEVSPF